VKEDAPPELSVFGRPWKPPPPGFPGCAPWAPGLSPPVWRPSEERFHPPPGNLLHSSGLFAARHGTCHIQCAVHWNTEGPFKRDRRIIEYQFCNSFI